MNRNSALLAPALALLLLVPAGAQVPQGASLGALGQPGPQVLRADYARTRTVISPVIHADHRVTLRLNAPQAHDVRATGHIIGPKAHWLSKDRSLPMTKGADGIWNITLGPLKPDIYDYGYTVDGVAASDPGNRLNLVEVPGPAPPIMTPVMCRTATCIWSSIIPKRSVRPAICASTPHRAMRRATGTIPCFT
jgi:hypothetical protein